MLSLVKTIFLLLGFIFTSISIGFASSTINTEKTQLQTSDQSALPQKIIINPTAKDKEIQKRLDNILQSTGWFENVNIKVEHGIVFLNGEAKTEKHQHWAEVIGNKTENVVAVVNNIKIISSPSWYITQLKTSLIHTWGDFLHYLPYLGLSIIILTTAWFFSRLMIIYIKKSLLARNLHPLLADVLARGFAILGFFLGLYIVLQVLGLTTIALSILGGTGVLGLILGIAFRDITENLLASVLLSIQSPFHNNDLVEIHGITGYVQALTIRTTVLLTQDGHEVQIPNATVYKSNIYNFSSTPNWREQFVIGIGYEDSISQAQEVALKILQEHPAVLHAPEPWILVDELGVSSVNLRIIFWLNGHDFHWQKVKSSVIRLVKRAFQDASISMPGQVVELKVLDDLALNKLENTSKPSNTSNGKKESSQTSTDAEGGLVSDKEEIQEQGKTMRGADQEKNLLQ
jgi:small-conductance mechanosensitive channel